MVNKETIDDLFDKCLDTWGEEKQLRMVQEECAELILAVSHHLRGRPNSIDNVKEELADVWLMVSQMIHYYGEEEVMEIAAFKSNRTLEKVKRYMNKEN